MNVYLTPSKIVEELDKYIIGQTEAKKSVAIALRNRWRRLNASDELRKEIIPNNIMMIGPTGVGKTEIARRLAKLADAPFVKVEASKFTEVGYVGRDVESMIRDLVEQAVNLVKAEKKVAIMIKAEENANERILDILIPPIKKSGESRLSDLDVEKSDGTPAPDSNERTREKFREKLRKGELDARKVEIDVTDQGQQVHIMGPGGGMEGIDGLQNLISEMIPRRSKRRNMTVVEAREYLTEEEAQKLIDMESVTKEALDRASNSGIIFLDEIDKIATGASKAGGPDVSREGVQRDLLPIVEGSSVNTKHGVVKTDHILFIAAGAFHVAKPSDLIPELQGRFPIRVELNSLTKEDFVKILLQPRHALTKQYQAMLESENVGLEFSDDAIEEIAEIAFAVNQDLENIGARRLHTIMSNLLNDILFEVPDLNTEKSFHIDRKFVAEKLDRVTKTKDLSHYIL